jgi:uncharacterized integral membrane protein
MDAKTFKIIAIVVLIMLAIVVIFQNRHVVSVNLLFWKAEMSQLILILLTLAIGFAGGYLTSALTGRKKDGEGAAG